MPGWVGLPAGSMIEGIQLKVCGLTSREDAEAAVRIGADWIGFNLYPASPRFLPLSRYRELAPTLPAGSRVAVMVEPDDAALMAALDAGFDRMQIHFRHDLPVEKVTGWSRQVGEERLWLAPKLPPTADVPADLLPLARHFLMDTFHAEGFGGSGRTGDWAKFARHQQSHPEKTWILAGGLSPENIADALTRSGARFVDVNSGVEVSPGIKDHARLKLLAEAIQQRNPATP